MFNNRFLIARHLLSQQSPYVALMWGTQYKGGSPGYSHSAYIHLVIVFVYVLNSKKYLKTCVLWIYNYNISSPIVFRRYPNRKTMVCRFLISIRMPLYRASQKKHHVFINLKMSKNWLFFQVEQANHIPTGRSTISSVLVRLCPLFEWKGPRLTVSHWTGTLTDNRKDG